MALCVRGKASNSQIKSLKLKQLDRAKTHTDLKITQLNLFIIQSHSQHWNKKT